jgi:hypothetical protein
MGGQQIQAVRTNQQSPGCSSSSSSSSKMPDHSIESNAFDNKNQPSSPSSATINNNNNITNNLLIMANEHKEFSSRIGDESLSSPVSTNHNFNLNLNINNINSNKNNNVKVCETESDESVRSSLDHQNKELKQTMSTSETVINNSSNIMNSGTVKSEAQNVTKNANLSVASNIANAFINLSNLSCAVPKNNNINNNNVNNTSNNNNSSAITQTKNMNLIVTQQQMSAQHFMKTLSFTTSRGIFVPNVIATNITPQFTVHPYGLHNQNGPAPNVTVNPNGNFNTNSSTPPGIRPPNHFRLLLQQQPPNLSLNLMSNANINANANVISNNSGSSNSNSNNSSNNPSPILEASLQTITKEATLQASKILPSKTPFVSQRSATPFSSITQQSMHAKMNEDQHVTDNNNMNNVSSSNSSETINADQHIRVLTPSEIMKTLPSLSTHDNICFNNSSISISSTENNNKQSSIMNETEKPQMLPNSVHAEISGSVTFTNNNINNINNNNNNVVCNNSANSSQITSINTITTNTSDCNTFSSNFTITTTKATAMSSTSNNIAQIIMVRGYKTYKNIFVFF